MSNSILIGSWIQIGHIASVESLLQVGFDWICLDLEHGIIGLDQLPQLLSVINHNSIPFARIPVCEETWVHRLLDFGAQGIIAPMVNTKEQAELLVSACKYPPEGTRGFGFSHCNGYGSKFFEYINNANDSIIVVAQIEHIDAIENLDSILSVPGINATMIGPYDLSGSMGTPGKFNSKKFTDTLDRYVEISAEHHVPTGIHIVDPTPDSISLAINQGHKLIALGTDCRFIYQTGSRIVELLKTEMRLHE